MSNNRFGKDLISTMLNLEESSQQDLLNLNSVTNNLQQLLEGLQDKEILFGKISPKESCAANKFVDLLNAAFLSATDSEIGSIKKVTPELLADKFFKEQSKLNSEEVKIICDFVNEFIISRFNSILEDREKIKSLQNNSSLSQPSSIKLFSRAEQEQER